VIIQYLVSIIKKQHKFYQAILLLIFSLGSLIPAQAEEIVIEPIRTFDQHSSVKSVAFSPDSQKALSAGREIALWNVNTGELINTFQGHTDWVTSVAFSPDGQWALSGSDDYTLKLWDVNTGSLVRSFTGHTSSVLSVAFSPDGQWALSGGGDWGKAEMYLWDVNTGSLVRSFTGHTSFVNSVAFSPDGQWALSGGRGWDGSEYIAEMYLWDVNTGSLVRTFTGHSASVDSVAFSPDGQWALSGSIDDTLKLWDVNTGSLVRSFTGHTTSVNSVAFSPDGQWVLSGGGTYLGAEEMYLWNVKTGRIVCSFLGYTDYVNSVAYSPNGKWVLSGSGSLDFTVRLFDVSEFANIAPTANFTLSTSYGEAPLYVSFDASGSTDSDGVIAKYDWYLNDTLFSSVGSNAPVSYTFPEGQHTIKLTVTDNRGLTTSAEKIITVTAPAPKIPPVAAFTLSANTGEAPLEVSFNGSSSSDSDGIITQYDWYLNGTLLASLGSNTPVFYTFSEGQHVIGLTVTDNDSLTHSTQKSITVDPPPVSPIEPIVEETQPPIVNNTNSLGQAIIIAASGSHPSNSLFKYSNEFAQRMYRLLKERGFSDESIHYMSPQPPDIHPVDGRLEPERQDYPLFDAEQEISQAFAQAAANLTAGQQFVFYLHGHAREDNIMLMPNYELTATHLRDLLATLPTNIQQIIIIDTCYSGSFMDDLAGENRIIISSTDDISSAFQVAYASFADTFIKQLYRGSSITEAFQIAENAILSEPKFFREQRPWLDDNGDGKYVSDGIRASSIFLGGEGISAAEPPTINHVHPHIDLDEGISTATLWAETTPKQEGIHQVQAILISPNFVSKDYRGEETDFGREELALIYNPAQNRHEIVYDGFCTEGTWQIQYQAQNTEGLWSDVVKVRVEAHNCSIVTTQMLLNQNRYTTNEQLRLDMEVKGNAEVDLYAAIVFPDGDFMTIAYPLYFSWPNAIQPYQTNVIIDGKKTYQIMDFPVPANVDLGKYQACGVLIGAGNDSDQSNWLHLHCNDFEVY